jgi:hypothetical protein
MSRYTLSINITSDNRDLLENLMVTLETPEGDISEVDSVELYSTPDAQQSLALPLPQGEEAGPSALQRNLFLDQWCLS